jgi:hypothetical protein
LADTAGDGRALGDEDAVLVTVDAHDKLHGCILRLSELRDPASSRPAGRRPDGFSVLHRVPRRGAATAGDGSKSGLKGLHKS